MPTERTVRGDSDEAARYGIPGRMPPGYTVDGEMLGPFTYSDYGRPPEDRKKELIRGFLVREPAPYYGHQALSLELSGLARTWKLEFGGVLVFTAPFSLFLDEYNVLQPDFLMFRKDKKKRLTRRGLEAPPELVAEILSYSTRGRDTGVKLELYSQFGVGEYWIVDPRERAIRRYDRRTDVDGLELEGEYRDGALQSSAFPTFSVDVGAFFGVLDEFD